MRLRRLVIVFVVWGVVLGTVYLIARARIDRAKSGIKSTGFETVQELAKLVSLPLLDSNAQTIHAMLVYAAKKTDTVHTSVVDHKNEIVAVTGAEQVRPGSSIAAHSAEHVSFWEGELPDHMKIFGFLSDVTYSGTKIGRIQIALSAEEPLRIRNYFIGVAVSACVILVLLIIAILYYPGVWAVPVRLMRMCKRDHLSNTALKNMLVTCPLCGVQKPISRELFKRTNFGRLLIIKAALNKSGSDGDAEVKSMHLSDLAKRDDFLWLKRQIVVRCAEIIKKLAA